MATITASGRQIEVQNRTLGTTDDTQVGFVNPCNGVIIKCRTAGDIQVRASRANPFYYTIPSGSSLQLDLVGNILSGVVQPTNIWLRSASGTVIAEVLGIYGG